MGGTIRVITVLDSKVHKQSRWTNPLPDYVQTDKFVEGNKEWVEEYLSHYETSAYAENDETFSPNGYGLDVFDFDNKVLLTDQGYCQYDRIDYATVALHLGGNVIHGRKKEDVPPATTRRMFEKGMLGLVNWVDGKGFQEVECPDTYDEAWKIIQDTNEYRWNTPRRGLDFTGFKKVKKPKVQAMSFSILWEKMGWKVIKFEESKAGFKKMLEYCKKNYNLTEEDINDWKEFLKDW